MIALLPILIGLVLAALVFLAFGGVSYLIFRKTRLSHSGAHLIASAGVGFVAIVAGIVWLTNFCSPLPLPKAAGNVQISRAFPFTWAIDDNLRFEISEEGFQAWIAELSGQPWTKIAERSTSVDFRRVMSMGDSLQRYGTAPWMKMPAVARGYGVKLRDHPGEIIYDADRHTVYYSFWD